MRFLTPTRSVSPDTVSGFGIFPSVIGRWSCRALLIGLALMFSGVGTAARADDELTLELPPSQAAQEAQAAERARASRQQARTSVSPSSSRFTASPTGGFTRGRLPSRGGQGAERVVGRLGQLEQKTRIYREPKSRSHVLIVAPAGTYVAIQGTQGDWFGVLMADGSTGWLHRQNTHLLDYQVVSSGDTRMTDGGNPYAGSGSALLTSSQRAILEEAYKYLGVRYVWGGNTASGIDCSGFVKNVFGACGYRLPRTATEQMAYGLPIAPEQLQAGDRLYFGHKRNRYGVTHTGIYIGNGYFIHSSSSRKGVAISRLSETMFARIYVCARR